MAAKFKITHSDLSFTHILHLHEDARNKNKMQNRIKAFKRQIAYHTQENTPFLCRARREVARIREMLRQYNLYYLIINNLKLKELKKELNQWPTVRKHWESKTKLEYIVKKPKFSFIKQQMLENLEESSMRARKSQHIWRIIQEMECARYFHKFVIFNTLTVAPEYYAEVFAKGSNHFKKYIEKFDKIYGKKSHTYFGVTEIGELGRAHYHVIHVLDTIPTTWKGDINYGMQYPTNRIIKQCQDMWQWGYSKPIAIRFNAFDAYAKLGWRWPVEQLGDDYVAIKETNANSIAFYMAKYITKSLVDKEKKTWRTKPRNNFGMTILNMAVRSMMTNQLILTIKAAPMMVLKIHNSVIPPYFLKKVATKYLLLRKKNCKSITKLIMEKEPQENIVKRLKSLTSPILQYKQQSSSFSTTEILTKQEISDLQKYFDTYTKKYHGYVNNDESLNIKGESIDRSVSA